MLIKRSIITALLLISISTKTIQADVTAIPPGGGSQEVTYDVVSVRQVEPPPPAAPGMPVFGTRRIMEYRADRVKFQLTLEGLIEEAFQKAKLELAGPHWLDEKIFLIQATMPVGTSREIARLMLQQVLSERFNLKVHSEQRIMPVYALIAGKDAVHLQAAGDPDHRKLKDVDTGAGKISAAISTSNGNFFASGITLAFFAETLGNHVELDLPVVNMTD